MRLMRTALFTAVLMGAATSAHSTCVRSGAGAEESFTWGSTKADANAAVGKSIAGEVSAPLKTSDYYRGCSGEYKLTGGFEPSGEFDNITNTYPTGIKGVGLRVTVIKGNESHVLGAGPMGFSITPSSAGRINLSGYKIKGELIKTASRIEPGLLSGLANVVAKLYLEGFENENPILTIKFNEAVNSVISNPSCSLLSHDKRNLTVTLPPVNLTAFKHIGAVDGETKANFTLKCQGGYDNVTTKIYTEFKSVSGEYGGDDGIDNGVLANEAEDNQVAKNIGVQVLINHRPIMFESEDAYGAFTGEEGTLDYNMSARYYQYGNRPTGGKVVARMIYTLSYQ